ncbi:PTS sugar transporter subunit IIA [Pluralibacter gergoviae]|uniref:PTS sugar transporter subunit IIA n=1 Tax=Pluralibacter gergoviae TaxID=61647 RepID=UPI00155F2658|nr:PTS sugar transporter subunit IIA [Pluralibacter gergoviae]
MMFSPQRIVVFNDAISRTALLNELAQKLLDDGFVKPDFAAGVLEREDKYPTGIDMETHSVAIPHTEFCYVNSTGFAIGINHAGVAFQRSDDPEKSVEPQIIVMMAIDQSCEKVIIIQSLFALLADPKKVEEICQKPPEEIAKIFTESIVTG